jgi:hypothetical protein
MISFNFNYFLIPNIVTLGVIASTDEFWGNIILSMGLAGKDLT